MNSAKALQFNRPSVFFFIEMHGVKEKLSRTSFKETEFFFIGFSNARFLARLGWCNPLKEQNKLPRFMGQNFGLVPLISI